MFFSVLFLKLNFLFLSFVRSFQLSQIARSSGKITAAAAYQMT